MEILDLNNVSQEEIKSLQDKNLEILEYFDAFCREHDLKYSLLGGTLIGAVRHKGFIPWDDDVDLIMPRPDYERLSEIWENKTKNPNYILARTNEEKNYHHAGTSIRDIRTTFINKHSQFENIEHAIGIEIVPIDAAAPTKIGRIRQLINAFVFALFNNQRLPDNKGRTIRILTKLLYILAPGKKIKYKLWKHSERVMSKYNWEESKNVTELIGSIKGMMILHPKEDFESTTVVAFEHLKLPIMIGYDRYLNMIFGDYMELPPVEERIAKHNTIYINTSEPYIKYENIHYFLNKQ